MEIFDGKSNRHYSASHADPDTVKENHMPLRKGHIPQIVCSFGFKRCFLPSKSCLSGKQLNGNKPCSSLMISEVAEHH